MKINFKNLFAKQAILDQAIYDKHTITDEQSTLKKRWIALLVELGELANETRCFKYWSVKKPSSQEVILEEYVDGIHFLLSIGNTINAPKFFEFHDSNKKELIFLFNDLFSKICFAQQNTSINNYLLVFQAYLQLGFALGFSISDIESGYEKKNAKNHQRQKENY